MKKFCCLGLATALASALAAPALQAGTIYYGAYPNVVVVYDEGKATPTKTLSLESGQPRSLILSKDGKRLYAMTISTSGIEVIDTASQNVIDHVSLNSGGTRYRIYGGVPDSTGRYFYLIGIRFDKLNDRYLVSKRQYLAVDMQEKKIVRAVDLADEDVGPSRRQLLLMSPDDKTLYVIDDKIRAVDTSNFKVKSRIDLAKPGFEKWIDLNFGAAQESQRSSSEYVTLLTASDAILKNKVFGIGRFNLVTGTLDFKPIGPAPDELLGLQVTPDNKKAYGVITNGKLGNKRCEFWQLDLTRNTVVDTREFECRSRLRFDISSDAKKLYVHGASYDMAIYDAKTMKLEKVVNMGYDQSGAGLVVVP